MGQLPRTPTVADLEHDSDEFMLLCLVAFSVETRVTCRFRQQPGEDVG
jgi:hypothetical protein